MFKNSFMAKRFIKQLPAALLAVLAAATILRFWGISQKSFWMDEIATVMHSRPPLKAIPGHVAYYQATPPLHYAAVHVFMKVFWESEFIVRLPSVLAGILSIPFLFLLGKEIYGEREGLIASFLLTFSSVHIFYSQEARTYSFFTFFILGSLLFLIRAFKRKRFWDWFAFGVFVSMSAHTHFFTAFFIAGEMALAFFYYLKIDRRYIKMDNTLFAGVLCLIIAGMLYYFTPSYDLLFKAKKYEHGYIFTLPLMELFGVVGLRIKEVLKYISLGGMLYVSMALLSISLVKNIIRRHKTGFLIILYFIIPLITAILFLENFKLYNPRYFVPLQPVYFLIMAHGMVFIVQMIERLFLRFGIVCAKNLREKGIILFAVILPLFEVPLLIKYYTGQKQDYRGGIKYIKENMSAKDNIIIGAFDGGVYDYYSDRLGLTEQIKKVTTLPELALLLFKNEAQAVWYTYSFGASENMTPHLFQWMVKHFKYEKNLPSLLGAGMDVRIFRLPAYYIRDNKGSILEEINKMKQNLKSTPDEIPLLQMLAHDYFLIKDFDKARIFYERVLKAEPNNQSARDILIYFRLLKEGYPSTDKLTADWIKKNIPANSVIAIAKELAFSELLFNTQDKNYEVFIMPQNEIFPFACEGYDYAVLADMKYQEEWKAEFYDKLFSRAELIKEIKGNSIDGNNVREVQNPGFKIIKLNKRINEIELKGKWVGYSNNPEARDIYYFILDFYRFPVPNGREMKVLEDNNELKRVDGLWTKPRHGIYTTGGTRGYLYISPGDGSNPNINGKKYILRIIKMDKK